MVCLENKDGEMGFKQFAKLEGGGDDCGYGATFVGRGDELIFRDHIKQKLIGFLDGHMLRLRAGDDKAPAVIAVVSSTQEGDFALGGLYEDRAVMEGRYRRQDIFGLTGQHCGRVVKATTCVGLK